MRVEVVIGSAAAIYKVALSNGHCIYAFCHKPALKTKPNPCYSHANTNGNEKGFPDQTNDKILGYFPPNMFLVYLVWFGVGSPLVCL